MKNIVTKSCLLGIFLITTNPWNVTHAQETTTTLEEIIVTAQKRQENLQTLGISVSAFDQDTLNALGTRDIVELSKFVPNLQIGTESSDLKAMIRGVGSDNLEAFGDPGVAIHIDGVYQARPSGGNSLYYDMERVEVLRGPQGTLYGRNANGGAINFISKKPSDEFEASMDYGKGDNNWQRFRGMVNLPMGDKASFRYAGTGLFGFPHNETQNGYQKNLIEGGTEGNDKDDATSKLQLLWEPTEKISLLFAGGETSKEGVGPIRKRTSAPGASTLSPNGTPANCDDCGFIASGGLRSVFKDTEESFDLLTQSFSITLDYDLGFATLTAIAADQSTDMSLVQDSDQSPKPKGVPGGETSSAVVTQRSDQETFEMRLTSNDDGPVEWLLGLYYLDENAFQNTLINRDPKPFGAAKTINVLHDVNADSSAFFGQFSMQPNETLKLTAGFRSTDDEKDAVGGTKVQIRPPAPGCNDSWPYCYVNVGSQSYSPEDSWSSNTYKLGIDKYLDDDRMVYATMSTGFKAGGFNFGVSSAESYDPEEVTAFEFGSKNRFNDGRMQLNASVFYYDYTDLQVFQVVDQTIVVRNAAEADITGAELEFVAAISDYLRVDASLGLLDTEYKKFILPSNLFQDDAGEPTNIDVSGNQLINAPKWSGHIGAERDYINNLGRFTLRGQLYISDDIYLRALNLKPYDHQDGYTTLDVKVMWESTDSHWFGEAFISNLTNEDVITNQEVTDSGIYFANLNRPRSWGVVLGYRF